MFNFDDKKFFGGDPCGHPGHFPHEKPRYTMTEEVEHTAATMRETIDRLLRFEERCKADFDGLMKNVTSDNVIFKTTMREAWATFIQEVKNEINVFEGNVDATVSLFQKDTESNYAKLSEDVHAQIVANLTDFNGKVTAFETAYAKAFDTFKDAINTRIENYNDNHSQAFADYQINVGIRLDNFEGDIRKAFDEFQTALNETVNNFKNTWATAIENRLDNQDANISNAVAYMKTNLNVSLENLLHEMQNEGTLSGIIDTDVMTTPEHYGAKGDGVTDDTNAIQQAINSGVPVVFNGSKTYLVGGTLSAIDNTKLNGNGCKLKCVVRATAVDVIKVVGVRNVHVDSIVFESVNSYVPFDTATYGNATNMSNCLAIHGNTVDGLTVSNCKFVNMVSAVKIDDTDVAVANSFNVTVDNCVVEGETGTPFYLGGVDGCVVNGCAVYASEKTTTLAHHIYVSSACVNHKYTRNTFTGGTGAAVNVASVAPGAVQPFNIVIDGNIFELSCGAFAVAKGSVAYVFNNTVRQSDRYVFYMSDGIVESRNNVYETDMAFLGLGSATSNVVKSIGDLIKCNRIANEIFNGDVTISNAIITQVGDATRIVELPNNSNTKVSLVNCEFHTLLTGSMTLIMARDSTGIIVMNGCTVYNSVNDCCVVWSSAATNNAKVYIVNCAFFGFAKVLFDETVAATVVGSENFALAI